MSTAMRVLTARRGDAWCDAAQQHGDNIAHIHAERGQWTDDGIHAYDYVSDDYYTTARLRVSYHYDRPCNAEKIVTAFLAAGCKATWTGNVEDCVHVDLTP